MDGRVIIIGGAAVIASEEYHEWLEVKEKVMVFWGEVQKVANEYMENALDLLMNLNDFVQESLKPKVAAPKLDFTRSKIIHQVADRKPRNLIKKIIF